MTYKKVLVKRKDGIYQHYYISKENLKRYKCVFGKYYIRVFKKKLTYFRYYYSYEDKSPRVVFDSYNVFGKSVFDGIVNRKRLENSFFDYIGYKNFDDMHHNMISAGYYLEIKKERYKVSEIKRYGGGKWIAEMESIYTEDID